jgi:hypothetical protein
VYWSSGFDYRMGRYPGLLWSQSAGQHHKVGSNRFPNISCNSSVSDILTLTLSLAVEIASLKKKKGNKARWRDKPLIFRRVRKIAKGDYYLRDVCLSVRPSAWNNSAPTGRIFIIYYIWGFFFENLFFKFKFH